MRLKINLSSSHTIQEIAFMWEHFLTHANAVSHSYNTGILNCAKTSVIRCLYTTLIVVVPSTVDCGVLSEYVTTEGSKQVKL